MSELFIILVPVLIHAIFAGSEIALVALCKSRIRKLLSYASTSSHAIKEYA